ncbi:methyltransferase, TIGR04325 family [Terriglobus roseus]|nr:methyltransferase, TIGR04325 family [Terriglobus roseus]
MLTAVFVGYRRPFPSLAAATAWVNRHDSLSHEHPEAVRRHMLFADKARASDYPALYHLQKIAPGLRTVIDIGGNAGNLFYCYAAYLDLSPSLRWTVIELPQVAAAGRQIALQRKETRLHFAEDPNPATSFDLAVFSGSLHYFEALPSWLFENPQHLPKYVLINRSPMVDDHAVAAVQRTPSYYAPAQLLCRPSLIRQLEGLNYQLLDDWPVEELNLRFPLHPVSSAEHYTGMFFRLRSVADDKIPT